MWVGGSIDLYFVPEMWIDESVDLYCVSVMWMSPLTFTATEMWEEEFVNFHCVTETWVDESVDFFRMLVECLLGPFDISYPTDSDMSKKRVNDQKAKLASQESVFTSCSEIENGYNIVI